MRALGIAVSLVGAFAATPSVAQPPISEQGRIFAGQVLGPERAARVERLEAISDFMAPWATYIRFYYPAAPLGDDLCQRAGHETVVDADPVRRARGTLHDIAEIAFAPGCHLRSGQGFAFLQTDISAMDAAARLRAVRDVQAVAIAAGALPFDLSCDDVFNEGCADARATLAALRLDQARFVDHDGVYIGGPWATAWAVEVSDRDGRRHVELRRRRPAPF